MELANRRIWHPLAYNVNPDGGPVSFIFDRNGDLVLRVSDARDLPAALARYF